jgi:hypothetical protein
MADFDRMRADRARWLAEIASVEAGNPPSASHLELGEPVQTPGEYVEQLKDWVEQTERHLADNGEPFDA